MLLMLIGNLGVVSLVASLVLTFLDTKNDEVANYWRILIIAGSLFTLWLLSRSKWLNKTLVAMINKALQTFTSLEIKDYAELLELTGNYEISVLVVKQDDWMNDKYLRQLELREEGVNIIGIKRKNNNYIGTPNGDTKIERSDSLIIYGRENTLANLEKRKHDKKGDHDHEKAMQEQSEEQWKEEQEDIIRKTKQQ